MNPTPSANAAAHQAAAFPDYRLADDIAGRSRTQAGRHRANSTRKGNQWLAGTLGEVVAGVPPHQHLPGERYRRIARQRGNKRAIVALG